MKSMALMSRKAGLSRAAFRAYYEEQHAPLACTYFPFRKYVRNHVVASEPPEVDFDVIGEFYMDSLEVAAEAYSGPVAKIMVADEANFMNSAMTRPVAVEEHLVLGSVRGEDLLGARRALYLLRDGGGEARAERLLALAHALAVARGVSRVTADCATGAMFAAAAPVDGFISAWLTEDAPMPRLMPAEDFRVTASVLTEIGETPGAAMAAAFRAG